MSLHITPASPLDGLHVGENLRPDDLAEVLAQGATDGTSAVLASMERSAECYAIRPAPEAFPCIIFGVSPHGAVWLLATPEVSSLRLAVVREARKWLSRWLERYEVLGNIADTRNSMHLRWIELMGFQLGGLIQVGDHAFQVFRMKKEGKWPYQQSSASSPS